MAESEISLVVENLGADKQTAPKKTRDYVDLIKEVYIDPIRSAIIVDDRYPTLEELLEKEDVQDKDAASLKKDKEGLRQVIQACRSQPKPWLVDIHDGAGLEKLSEANQHFKRLHQSDLIILDYNLDGEGGGNEKACNVLKSLSSNNYFNLVIIYTQCTDQELVERVAEIVKRLTFYNPNLDLPKSSPDELVAWENRSSQKDDISEEIKAVMDLPLFLELYQEPDSANWKGIIEGTKLGQLLAAESTAQKSDITIPIVRWLLAEKSEIYADSMSSVCLGRVEFKAGTENWIRTNTLFVTVIRKAIDAAELPDRLLAALQKSDPSPHRLLMTKIRNVLDEKGISAERNILSKIHMQAGWLKEMLNAKDEERNWKLKKTVAHHWEELANQVNPDVQRYAEDLFLSILAQEADVVNKVIQRFTSIDISKPEQVAVVTQEWNSYICSKEVDGHHLMTGHIFELTAADNSLEHWVCLTPICDLVPREGNQQWGGISVIDLIPFKAVKLIEEDNKKALKDATKNEHIFIGSGQALKCYRYSKSSNASPTWNQFFAHNSGKFNENRKITISSFGFSQEDDTKVTTVVCEVKLVTQLRYEYALHLLQKLGGSFSKVGLEFVKMP